MIKTAPAALPTDLTKAEALNLTERIRNSIQGTYLLVEEAYERKAWKAMGYPTWEAYVRAEFDMSRGYAYRLIDQGRVIRAIEEVVGDLSPIGDKISEYDARTIKGNLPEVRQEIQSRIESGQEPEQAVRASVTAAKQKAKANRAAEQAQWDAQRADVSANLNPEIKARQQAKDEAIAARNARAEDALEAELEELREANAALEAENAELKAELKKLEDMRLEYERGGFEEVIAGLKETLRVANISIERESAEKIKNLRSMEWWKKEAIKLGWSNDEVIELEGNGDA